MGRTGAFGPYDDAWGTQGWSFPSRCQFDSPNDAFPEVVGICGEKGRAAGLTADGFATFGRAFPSSGIGAAAKLLTRDEARRIAANIAKLPELLLR